MCVHFANAFPLSLTHTILLYHCMTDPRDKPPATGNVLAAGAHEYPFQYTLPKGLPSSFESQDLQFKGRVHYLLRAKLDTPDESVRTNTDRIFLVLSTLDLNKEQKAAVRNVHAIASYLTCVIER